LRGLTNPTRQYRFGLEDVCIELVSAIGNFRRLLLRLDDICGHPSASRKSGRNGFGKQPVLFLQIVKERAAALQVVAIQPGDGSVSAHRENADAPLRLSCLQSGRSGRALRLTLGPVRDVLHQPDPGHREVIASETPLVRAGDWQILHSEGELRVRQTPGGDRCGSSRFDIRALLRQVGRRSSRDLPRARKSERRGGDTARHAHKYKTQDESEHDRSALGARFVPGTMQGAHEHLRAESGPSSAGAGKACGKVRCVRVVATVRRDCGK